jgi:adenine/guanine/hypoxanthine permease
VQASLWCWAAAVLSAVGLMHSYRWEFGDTALSLSPAWPWVVGYGAMGLVFFCARWVTVGAQGESLPENQPPVG